MKLVEGKKKMKVERIRPIGSGRLDKKEKGKWGNNRPTTKTRNNIRVYRLNSKPKNWKYAQEKEIRVTQTRTEVWINPV